VPPQPGTGAVAVAVAGVAGVFGPTAASTSWKVVAGETNGQPLPAERIRGARAIVSGSTVVVLRAGQPPMVTRCAADLGQTPNRLTLTVVEGAHRGQTAPAIAEMLGNDRMRICYAVNATEPPREFRTLPGGAQQFLFTLQIESSPSAPPTLPNRGGPPVPPPTGRSGGGGG
jgi:uncharacterized protein (TIGR03067 family)